MCCTLFERIPRRPPLRDWAWLDRARLIILAALLALVGCSEPAPSPIPRQPYGGTSHTGEYLVFKPTTPDAFHRVFARFSDQGGAVDWARELRRKDGGTVYIFYAQLLNDGRDLDRLKTPITRRSFEDWSDQQIKKAASSGDICRALQRHFWVGSMTAHRIALDRDPDVALDIRWELGRCELCGETLFED